MASLSKAWKVDMAVDIATREDTPKKTQTKTFKGKSPNKVNWQITKYNKKTREKIK